MPKLIQAGLWHEEQGVFSLIGSRCPQCGGKHFPARQVCSHCYAEDMPVVSFAGKGKIYAFTQVYIKSPLITEHPYAVGYVMLDDGITVPARLIAVTEQPAIGMPVVLEAGRTGQTLEGEEVHSYFFRLLKQGENE